MIMMMTVIDVIAADAGVLLKRLATQRIKYVTAFRLYSHILQSNVQQLPTADCI